MTHDEYKVLIEFAALGTLEADEQRALDEHLATCTECRALLSAWQNLAAEVFALSVPPVAPPAELRGAVLNRLKETGQVSSLSNARATRAEAANTASSAAQIDDEEARASATKAAKTPRAFVRQVTLERSALWSAAIAAVLVIAVLVALLVVLWRRNTEARRELASTHNELARERAANEVFAAPDARIHALAGTGVAPRARAKLAIDRRTGRAAFYAYDLPPAPVGKAYELWYIADGKPIAGSVFNTNAAGHAALSAQVPAQGRSANTFAVTLEPAQGASSPTGDKFLLGTAAS